MCVAHEDGSPERLPVKAKKKPPKEVAAAAVWLERRGKLLAVRRGAGGLLGGLWGPPSGDLEAGEAAADAVLRQSRTQLGLELENVKELGQVKHIFTHRSLTLHVYWCDTLRGRARYRDFESARWLRIAEFEELPQSSLARKALALFEQRRPGRVMAR
jgi:A/G-specific adenine glycosylase